MSQGSSAINSELWVDLNQAASDYNRSEVLSSVLVRAVDTAAVQSLINELKADQRLNVAAVTEQEYYDAQMISAAPMRYPRNFRRRHHGGRQLFRRDEYDVCGCGASCARSRNLARARVLPRRHPL